MQLYFSKLFKVAFKLEKREELLRPQIDRF